MVKALAKTKPKIKTKKVIVANKYSIGKFILIYIIYFNILYLNNYQ